MNHADRIVIDLFRHWIGQLNEVSADIQHYGLYDEAEVIDQVIDDLRDVLEWGEEHYAK